MQAEDIQTIIDRAKVKASEIMTAGGLAKYLVNKPIGSRGVSLSQAVKQTAPTVAQAISRGYNQVNQGYQRANTIPNVRQMYNRLPQTLQPARQTYNQVQRPVGNALATLGTVGKSTYQGVKRTVEPLGYSFGTAVRSPWEQSQINRDRQTLQSSSQRLYNQALQARQQGNPELARRLTLQAQNQLTPVINRQRQLGVDQSRFTKPQMVSSTLKTGASALAGGVGLRSLLATSTLGGGLSAGIAKWQGQDSTKAFGAGIAEALPYAFINKLTDPVYGQIANRVLGQAANPLAKIFAKGGTYGLANLVENEITTRMFEGRGATGMEQVFAGGMGVGYGSGSQAFRELKNVDFTAISKNLNIPVAKVKEAYQVILDSYAQMTPAQRQAGFIDPNAKLKPPTSPLSSLKQEVTTKPIKIFRAEDSKTGVSAVADGRYFADSLEGAKRYGDVITETTIPSGSKILNFDAIKNKPNQKIIPQEVIRDPKRLAEWASDNGYNYIKNTNTKGVEYVELSKKVGNWEFDSGGALPGEPLAWTKDGKYGVLDELDEAGEATGRYTLNTETGKELGVFDTTDEAIKSLNQSTTPKVDPLSSLKQEAPIKLYRGGLPFDKKMVSTRGISLTPDPSIAKEYSTGTTNPTKFEGGEILKGGKGVVEEYTISPTAKILQSKDIPSELLRYYKNESNVKGIEKISAWAKSQGYDAVDFTKIGGLEVRVLNPDILQSTTPKGKPTLPGTTPPTLKQLDQPKLPDELQLPPSVKPKIAAKTVVGKEPIINTKRDIPIKDVFGNKAVLPAGEAYTPHLTSDNKIILKDGEQFLVNKSTYDNVKGQSVKGEAKPFAPELEGLEESYKGVGRWSGDEYVADGQVVANIVKNDDGTWSYQSDLSEGSDVFKTRKEAMDAVIDEITNPYAETGTKYNQYTLPGGENYREVLIKAPIKTELTPTEIASLNNRAEEINKIYSHSKLSIAEERKLLDELKQIRLKVDQAGSPTGTFRSSHWDEPNVISHIRMNDRTYKGKKVAFMEELQSDWAREGRSKGFSELTEADIKSIQDEFGGTREEAIKLAQTEKGGGGIPYNPLLKNWQEPTIKRALKDAVDNDAEYFAWINGEQTSARYNLATYVDEVKWNPSQTGGKTVKLSPKAGSSEIGITLDKNGGIIASSQGDWKGKQLDEVLGKGLADRIMGEEKGTLSGEGLKFGGEWANNLYDKQVKSIVEKLTGGKVEEIDLGLPIEKDQNSFQVVDMSQIPTRAKLTSDKIKVGSTIYDDSNSVEYTITDVLGDGKFRAVDKNRLEKARDVIRGLPVDDVWEKLSVKEKFKAVVKISPDAARGLQETFDISTKPTTQQAIRLTPEIKARIKGEAPPLKQPSNKEPDLIRAFSNAR